MYAIFLCHYDVTRWWNKGSLMATAQVAFVLMCLSFPERSRKKFLNVQSLRSVFCILQSERWRLGAMDFFSKTKDLSLLLFALSTMILFSSTSARHLRKEHKIIRHGTKKKQNCNNTTKDHKVRCRDKLKLCKKQAELHNVKLGTIVAGSRPGRLHAKHEKTRGGTNKKYSNNFTTKDRETKCHHERTKCEMQAKVAKGKSFYSFYSLSCWIKAVGKRELRTLKSFPSLVPFEKEISFVRNCRMNGDDVRLGRRMFKRNGKGV